MDILKDDFLEGVDLTEGEDLAQVSSIVSYVTEKYYEAKDAREPTEQIWLEAEWAYRGEYSPDQRSKIAKAEARNPGASSVYIKVSKTKIQAAYGQLTEILFSGNRFPISVEPTPIPEGIAEMAYIEPEQVSTSLASGVVDVYGYNGDGKELPVGATSKSLLGSLADKFAPYLKGKTVKEGPSPDKTVAMQIHPAEQSARAMEKQIHDQLAETNAAESLDKAAFQCTKLGTGVLKGPFNYIETVHKYEQDPMTKRINYLPYPKLVPKLKYVSCWNVYPDPAATCQDELEYVVERHKLARSKVRELSNRPLFDKDAIKKVLKTTPKMDRDDWEDSIRDANTTYEDNRYEVLEFWGVIDLEMAEEIGIDLSSYGVEFFDSVQVNVWICNGEVLRAVANPFLPKRIPYVFVPYEVHSEQIWGIGVGENMRDTQAIMNGHMRMAIDNLRLAGSVMLEVNENQMVPNQDYTISPGKIWRKQGGAVGQSIYSINVNNTAPAHIQMFDKARQLADEAVGLPSFSHGITGVSGTGRTAAGISMLMGAAAGSIKTVVKNWDRYGLEPLGKAMFQWNMQFNEENVTIRGDLNIVALGTKSLMQREVLTQRLLSFLQITSSNPALQAMANMQEILKQIAISMDLDPDKVVNDPQQAAMYAELIGKINGSVNGSGSPQAGQIPSDGSGVQGASGAPQTADTSGNGGGNIGAGSAAAPGTAGFSAAA